MQKNYKSFIKWIVALAILSFLVIHFALRKYGESESFWALGVLSGDIGYTSAFVCLVAGLFNWIIWRIPLVGRWFHTPNISGVWEGHGKSSHNGEEYSFKLKIRQTFFKTNVHGYFEKSQSDSFSAVFVHNDTIDKTVFVYSYQNDPLLEYRNKAERNEEGGVNIHYGTTKISIDYDDLSKLTGTYWNDRECVGSIELTKQKKDGK